MQRGIRGARGAWPSSRCPLAHLATQTTDRRQQRGQAVQGQQASPAIRFIDPHPLLRGAASWGRRTPPGWGEENRQRNDAQQDGSPSCTTVPWDRGHSDPPPENQEGNATKWARRPQSPREQQCGSGDSLGSRGCCPSLHSPTLGGVSQDKGTSASQQGEHPQGCPRSCGDLLGTGGSKGP